jgi:hypothetical protein
LPSVAPSAPAPGAKEGRSSGASEAVEPIDAFLWPIQAPQMLVSERDSEGATRYRVLDP